MQSPAPEGSSSKRLRTSQACNECRKRKSKCGGELPSCTVCWTLNRPCTYTTSKRKRGLPSGYVRSLEIVLGILLRHFPRSDTQIQDVVRTHYGTRNLLEQETSEFIVDFWRRSALACEVDKLLDSSDWAPVTTSDSKQRTAISISSVESLELEQSLPHEFNAARTSDYPTTNSQAQNDRQEATPRPPPHSIASKELLYHEKLPTITADLIDYYFKHVHCWFPILKKSDVLKGMYTTTLDPGNSDYGDLGQRLCLWAIVAYGLANRQFDEHEDEHARLQRRVRAELVAHEDFFELSHIQALLILILLKMSQRKHHLAWILVAQAGRMIQTYGEERSGSGNRYRRTVCGCALLDSILSGMLGKRPCLSSMNVFLFQDPLNDDTLDEWELWSPPPTTLITDPSMIPKQPLRALSAFQLMLELMQQIHKWLDGTEDNESVDDCIRRMEDWKSHLPPHFHLPQTTFANPPVLHIHLLWYFAVNTVLRHSTVVDQYITDFGTQIVQSTEALSRQCLRLTGAEGCSPLVTCCLLQAQECLHYIARSTRGTLDVNRDRSLNALLDELVKQTQADRDRSGDGAGNRAGSFTTSPTPVGQNQTTRSQAQHPARTGADDGMDRGQSRSSIPKSALRETEDNETAGGDEDVFGGSTDWDSWFESVAPLVPANRVEQIPLFSQNLGFLTSNIEADWDDLFQTAGVQANYDLG